MQKNLPNQAVAWTALLLGAAISALAQGTVPDAPQVTEINPPSAARGSTVDVTLGGQKLTGTRGLSCRFSAYPDLIPLAPRGLKAEVLSAAEGQVRAQIAIAPDAPPGLHEIRALAAAGVTTPQYFYVSQYEQKPEAEPNNTPAQANPITLPVTIAGTVGGPEDRDCFVFDAKQGERLVFDVEGFKRYAPAQNNQQGISYLDSFLVLRDPGGNEIAYDDDSSRLDAFLAFQFPADGKYTITIRDSIYRGRGDFHYRLTIGSRPTITAIFPAGGPKGTKLVATVYGHNLDSTGATSLRRAIDLPSSTGTEEFRLTSSAGVSNAVPVVSTDMFETPEVEPNEKVNEATAVIVPVTCSGKFDSVSDVDGYRFEGQAGHRLVFQITASKLGSPVDTYLTLKDRAGAVIARDDDGGGMPDARMEVTLPRSDDYVIYVRNQQRTGAGPQYFYRLAIRPLRPGFTVGFRQDGVNFQGQPALVAVDSLTVQQGATTEFTLDVNRSEGQDGDVTPALNLPPGAPKLTLEQITRPSRDAIDTAMRTGKPVPRTITTAQPVVKNGQNSATLRLTAPADAAVGTYPDYFVRLSGLAAGKPFSVNKSLWLTIAPK